MFRLGDNKMENDKICPHCGGLMTYSHKHFPLHTYYIYLCLHCGHIEVMGWDSEKIII